MNKTFYLTTTLPYVNAPLHMGHALEFVRADTIVRYKKLLGYDVYFNTGTDEHGLKIFEKAKEQGISAQVFVDQGFETFKEQLKMFGVVDDIHFIRTTDENHEKAAQEFWKRVSDNGYIYKKNYEAKYCVGCESEKTDGELVNGYCQEHPGIDLKIINEENYFFKYSAFGDKLLEFYNKNPNFVIPDFRLNEIKNFVKSGLQDFSISRLKEKMPWGIPVPGDDTQVMYVWFDALVNYISTLGWPASEGNFEKYWVNGNPTQYCGKDNTRFQSAMWQAMLMAAGVENSRQIVVNGFITGEGGIRMSKTLGNVVDPRDIVKEYGTDALRYFLLREVGSFEDSPFTIERFKDSYNSGLANGLGNLASRILTLSEKYLEKCPEIPEVSDFTEYFKFYESFDIKKATDYVWEKIAELDKIIQDTQPFKVVKTDEEKGKEMIKDLVLKLYVIARMLNPIMPETNIKLKELIKQNKKPETPLFLRK
ncbi:MAG: Methionyl-tRNA synthetase [Candidatus Nomurabacteria bacterium GW2011_GWF2_35_66]|uniref:Methionine--tRNA ligase n=1 Tax=Candidatus Nomurabacteria bacterium GW2011_GWE1_35_16 TaxID=1618761 RepID=A0A0G0BAI3_9BACT|nr:MAG: Methionyl-tRNA synthetase [Candidatus Nomurabacteria bacterium GW2011_GWF1_34_20]KKP66364.1 MAG: Methionyl-tRNA synthetase [Candidatus Nomurabacteria bacterium GW2011_GWE1_35_16]KKP83196.1 MAG: Methionyl-tRNA synthetase [Candidatus Nomurabacteria bacterium GW2011_GWF2_35_66]HAE36543.1 methionine--tRNA ligase [Candidatus Nomurabacteria bacterium]HAX65216.1 methionine--tRNA ligase [Candidatus Nomurabacteria bacterium]